MGVSEKFLDIVETDEDVLAAVTKMFLHYGFLIFRLRLVAAGDLLREGDGVEGLRVRVVKEGLANDATLVLVSEIQVRKVRTHVQVVSY